MNIATAVRLETPLPIETPADLARPRRFMAADLATHGAWLIPRMMKAYPELSEAAAVGWIKGFVVSNEYLFLRLDNAVALAQLMPGYTLVPAQIVQERFVWVADPKNQQQVEQAAQFYGEIYDWANRLSGIQHLIVDENTDVPRALIAKSMVKGKDCRLLTREMAYVRVKER